MKKFRNLILAAVLGSSMVACDSLLDLEPQASISDNVALTSPQNVRAALIGAYDILGNGNAYGGSYVYLTDLMAVNADEVNWIGTFIQPGEVTDKVILTTNSYVSAYWNTSYNLINRTNNILAALDVFQGPEAEDRPRVEAEAKVLRAMAYYNLVQVFGKAYNDGNPSSNPGVPLVLTPTLVIDETAQIPRNTVQEVYSQVLQDLGEALPALPLSNGYYVDRFVAHAFLARVHLSMGNYSEAVSNAHTVIANGGYDLESSFADNFNRTSNGSETIFAMQVTVQDGANDNTTFTAPRPAGRADVQILDGHLELYESGDERAEFFLVESRGRMTSKYSVANRNINVIRLAEMLLIRAESNFRLTGNASGVGGVTPADDINMIRQRAGLDPVVTVTLADILSERHVELFLEGHLLSDLKRNQGVTTSAALQGVIQWTDPRLVFPIPNREMLVNSQLVQNEGYN